MPQFAEQHVRELSEINLERYPDLATEFASKNPSRLVDVLEALPNVGHIRCESLLFLDEIQAVPEAIPMLGYFHEDMGGLPVLAADSLLEFVLSESPNRELTYGLREGRATNAEVDDELLSLPLYLVERLPALIASHFDQSERLGISSQWGSFRLAEDRVTGHSQGRLDSYQS